jgi:hypothetical protein
VKQNVLRLYIAMHHLVSMRVVECGCDFSSNAQCVVEAELAFLVELMPQRIPFHVRHHIVEESVCFARIEHRQDVIVCESCRHLDLAKEPLGADFGGDLRAENLYCDSAFMTKVAREVDDGHSAFAELALD